MPNTEKLRLILSKDAVDIKDIRLKGTDKTLENMTIGELVQLRTSSLANMEECDSINAVGDNISVSSSCVLSELGRVRAEEVMKNAVIQQEITQRTLGISKTPGSVLKRVDNLEYANVEQQEPPKQESPKKRILERYTEEN